MSSLSPSRLARAALFGAAAGAWYAAFLLAVDRPPKFPWLGVPLPVAVAGGAALAVALLALEHFARFDREGLIPEATVWTTRVVSSHRRFVLRWLGFLTLFALVPIAGFAFGVILAVLLPLQILRRERLEGAPEQYELDTGGLGCVTLFVVIILSNLGGWARQGYEWVVARLEMPNVLDATMTSIWSVVGTVGTFILANAIIDRADIGDIRALVTRFLSWRAIAAAVAFHVRVAFVFGAFMMPLATIFVLIAGAVDLRVVEAHPTWGFTLIAAPFIPLLVFGIGCYTLVLGRLSVRLFPERVRLIKLPEALPAATS